MGVQTNPTEHPPVATEPQEEHLWLQQVVGEGHPRPR